MKKNQRFLRRNVIKSGFSRFFLFAFFTISASSCFAQKQANTSATATENKNQTEKMASINSCPELSTQLAQKFGTNYNLKDEKVMNFLEQNIKNEKASDCVRKTSLYVIYGEDYRSKLHLISNQNTK